MNSGGDMRCGTGPQPIFCVLVKNSHNSFHPSTVCPICIKYKHNLNKKFKTYKKENDKKERNKDIKNG